MTEEVVEGLRASMPRFASYMDAALAGQPVEPIAVGLARTLRVAGGAADLDALKNLIEIEAREVAQLPSDYAEAQEPAAEETPSVPLPAPVATEAVAEAPPAIDETPDAAPPPAPALEFDVVMTDEVPPELAEVFGEEAQGASRDDRAPDAAAVVRAATDRESVQELRRAVHTLKGAAGVVGYKGASKLAHRMEDLLDRLYEGDGGADVSRDAGPGVLVRLAARLDRRDRGRRCPAQLGHPPVRGVRCPGRAWPCLDVRRRNGRVRGRRDVRTAGRSPRA